MCAQLSSYFFRTIQVNHVITGAPGSVRMGFAKAPRRRYCRRMHAALSSRRLLPNGIQLLRYLGDVRRQENPLTPTPIMAIFIPCTVHPRIRFMLTFSPVWASKLKSDARTPTRTDIMVARFSNSRLFAHVWSHLQLLFVGQQAWPIAIGPLQQHEVAS